MTPRSLVRATCLVLVCLWLGPSASAHDRSRSFSTWHIANSGEVTVSYSLAAQEAMRLAAGDAEGRIEALFGRHLQDNLRLSSASEACPVAGDARPLLGERGHLRLEMRFRCPPEALLESSLRIDNQVLFDLSPAHVHIARVEWPSGATTELLFAADERQRLLAAEQDLHAGSSFQSFLKLGVEHILSGWDHLAFLLSLLLVARDLRSLVWMVTGFTVGHSLTLALAASGWVRVDSAQVEALIAFTIALVAAEAMARRHRLEGRLATLCGLALAVACGLAVLGYGLPWITLGGLGLFTVCYLRTPLDSTRLTRLRPAMTALFGLVHGFGFAGILLEIGLPTERLLVSLLGFNLGVELGQLLVVAAAWVLGRWLAVKLGERSLLVGELTAALLVGLGVYWFVSRAYGAG